MITLLNNQLIALNTKMILMSEQASSNLGSDYYGPISQPWLADELTVQSLFPQWIIKAYQSNPNNVAIVPLIKNYMRWLLSQDYGYGAQLNWENIRVPLFTNTVFLEALADFYFPDADFSGAVLNPILPNIRRFLIKSDSNYFNIKGTPQAIKYLICSLLGFAWTDVIVNSGTYCTIEIKIASASSTNFANYKPFLEKYVVPAGMSVNYTTF